MRRLIGFGSIVLLVWAAVEVYTKGVDGAFGGRLASSGSVETVEQVGTASERAANAFQRAYDSSEHRVDRLVEDAAGDAGAAPPQ